MKPSKFSFKADTGFNQSALPTVSVIDLKDWSGKDAGKRRQCTLSEEKFEWADHLKAKAISWASVEINAKCHPARENLALAWVYQLLGYLPSNYAYMPYLAFMQTLVENVEGGIIAEDVFIQQMISITKQIRNDELKKDGPFAPYTDMDHRFYQECMALFRDDARRRLAAILGYEPLLDYSLEAEMGLRIQFEKDPLYAEKPFDEMDYMARELARYRQAYFEHGEAAADDLDLLGRSARFCKIWQPVKKM